MAKILRKEMKVFGSAAGPSEISQYGSLAANAPAFSTDPDVIQALGNYLSGWYGAVIGGNSPAIQDMNALCYLYAYQLAYLMQSGIPEWDVDTTYYIGSIVNGGDGKFYSSLTNDNTGNLVSDTAEWKDILKETNDRLESIADLTGQSFIHSWTQYTAPNNNQWTGICWAEELGLYVAIASSSASGQQVMTSPQGERWLLRTAASASNWFSITWSPQLSLLVAVGTDVIMTSPTGTTWTSRTSPANSAWSNLAWSPELNIFVSVAASGTSTNRAMYSTNGTTWTAVALPVNNQWQGTSWSPELGLFVAVAATGVGNRVMTSSNGTSWTIQASAADNSWRQSAWSPKLGLFAAVSSNGAQRIMTSPDGINWTLQPTPASMNSTAAGQNIFTDLLWAEEIEQFIAIGQLEIYSSFDGVNWVEQPVYVDPNGEIISMDKCAWSSSLKRAVIVCTHNTVAGNDLIMISK